MSGSWRHIPFDGRYVDSADLSYGIWVDDETRACVIKDSVTGKWGVVFYDYRFDSPEAAIVAFQLDLHRKIS